MKEPIMVSENEKINGMSAAEEATYQMAVSIVKRLRNNGYEAYFVGGCVRDMLLFQMTNDREQTVACDIDIATSAKPEEIEKIFKRTIPVGKQFGVMLVVEGGIEFEVATFRSDGAYVDGRRPCAVHFSSAEEDAKRRDFTINGLFYDPIEKQVIDYVSGERDLQQGILRAIGDPKKRFQEDKLRILRAVRFASRFAFPIEKNTYRAIHFFVPDINQVSMERIRDEFVKMLTGPRPHAALALLDELGLLTGILPEVTAMKGVAQNPEFHPEGDVFTHTMLMLEELRYPYLILALAVLFHDIGKPATHDPKTLKTTFHADVGAKITEKILKRFKFSSAIIEKVSWCVRNHMNFMHVQKMREGKLKRLMSLDTFMTELELHHIDCKCSHGMQDNYEFLLLRQKEYAEEELKPKPIINGTDLIDLGLRPGPLFKEILDEAWNLQLENVFTSKEQACAWVKEKYAAKNK
jgi:poly(A) polymerase